MNARESNDGSSPLRLLAILGAGAGSFHPEVAGSVSSRPVSISVAETPESAFDELRDGRFDVVVCRDAAAVRAVREVAVDVPLIALVRPRQTDEAIEAMRSGVDEMAIETAASGLSAVTAELVDRAINRAAKRRRDLLLMRALAQINQTVYVTDTEGRIQYVNDMFCRAYGYHSEDMVGRQVATVWADEGPHDLPPTPLMPQASEGEEGECAHRGQNGVTFPVLVARSPIRDAAGHVLAWVGAVHDISQRRAREQALRESEERYALAAAGASDGLWDWDLRTKLAYFSSRWRQLLGYPEDEIGDRLDAWLERVHPDDRSRLESSLDSHIAGDSDHFECEHRIRTHDGAFRWMISRGLAVRDHLGVVYRIAGSMRDVTDRRQTAERLNRAALRDPLTELPNRALFMDRLSHAVRRERRQGEGFGVIFLDLDKFKRINDEHGHVVGDKVLRAVSRRLATCLRAGDTVSRLGGDEFAILLENLETADDARRVATRAAQSLERPVRASSVELYVAASMGIAIADPTGPRYDAADDILRDADAAMYRAKSVEGTRHVLFSPSMGRRPTRGPDLERELASALNNEQLALYYQPILDLKLGTLSGFEALLRWRHPERGLLLPHEFLSASSDIGMAVPIGRWVLREALAQVKDWRQASGESLVMTVNLGDAMLASGELGGAVSDCLDAAALPGESLEFDVAESVIMLDGERAAEALANLGRASVGFAVDNFGTSASSIGQLCRLPIDTIKIDRSLISRISIDERDLVIVRAIINMARQIGIGVAAEGIETLEQLALLRTLGCDRGQGHLFSRALTATAAGELLVRGIAGLPRLIVLSEGIAELAGDSAGESDGEQ